MLTRKQGWRIIEGKNGFQIVSMFDEVLRIALDISQNIDENNFTADFIKKNVTAVLMNFNESMWRVAEENGLF